PPDQVVERADKRDYRHPERELAGEVGDEYQQFEEPEDRRRDRPGRRADADGRGEAATPVPCGRWPGMVLRHRETCALDHATPGLSTHEPSRSMDAVTVRRAGRPRNHPKGP